MTSDWKKRSNGEIQLEPTIGFSTGVLAGSAIMLRLETVPDAAALTDGRRNALQTVLTPPQARELAEMLLKAAERTERTPPAGNA